MSDKKEKWVNDLLHVQDIHRALVEISRNTRRSIQFNHAISYFTYDTSRILKSIVRECVKDSRAGFEGITRILNRKIRNYQTAREVATMDPSSMEITIGRKKFKAGCGFFNPRIVETIDEEIESLQSIEEICSARTVLVVPKNGDKATSDYRKFITKPYILEVILGSICHRMGKPIKSLEPLVHGNMEYRVFGSRIIDDKLAKYVIEYGDFVNEVMSAEDNQYFMYFDIKSFFQSIDTYQLSNILLDNMEGYKPQARNKVCNFIQQCFVFPTVDLRESTVGTTEYDQGLTIETHYQHFMANVYLREIMTAVFDRLHYMSDHKVKVISYIDDFYIFADSASVISTVFSEIKAVMRQFNLGIAEQKTSAVMQFGEHKGEIKQLSRLPATNYFEMINLSQSEDANFTAYSENSTREELAELFGVSNQANLVFELFKNKVNVMADVEIIRNHLKNDNVRTIENTLSVFNIICKYPEKIQRALKKVIARMIFEMYTGKKWCYLYGKAFDNIGESVIPSVHPERLQEDRVYWGHHFSDNHSFSYHSKASIAMMYLQDLQFWIDNRERFIVKEDEASQTAYLRHLDTYLHQIKNDEANILDCMQQFALTKLPSSKMFASLFASRIIALKNIVMEKYPAKINYMAGIVQTFRSKIEEINLMSLVTRYTENDADACFNVLSTSKDATEINYAYFAYRFYRYNIIP